MLIHAYIYVMLVLHHSSHYMSHYHHTKNAPPINREHIYIILFMYNINIYLYISTAPHNNIITNSYKITPHHNFLTTTFLHFSYYNLPSHYITTISHHHLLNLHHPPTTSTWVNSIKGLIKNVAVNPQVTNNLRLTQTSKASRQTVINGVLCGHGKAGSIPLVSRSMRALKSYGRARCGRRNAGFMTHDHIGYLPTCL